MKGAEEPPADAVSAAKPAEGGEAQAAGEQVPAGIPEFWLGVLRANEVTSNVVCGTATSAGWLMNWDCWLERAVRTCSCSCFACKEWCEGKWSMQSSTQLLRLLTVVVCLLPCALSRS